MPRPVSRLELGLGSGPNVVGRLGSGVWDSASFQLFALTAGECPGWRGKLSGRVKCPGDISRRVLIPVNSG